MTVNIVLSGKYKNLHLEVIDGGLPSVARNNGAKLAKADYVLFLDADIFLTDRNTIYETLRSIKNNRFHLVTTKFRVKGFYFFNTSFFRNDNPMFIFVKLAFFNQCIKLDHWI